MSTMTTRHIRSGGLLTAVALFACVAGTAAAHHPGPWSGALKIDEIAGNSSELNTTTLDGCPIEASDGLSLYIASNRPGGIGGLDI